MNRIRFCMIAAVLAGMWVFGETASCEDVAVLRTGSRVTGKVTSYDAVSVSMDVKVGARTISRKYPVTQIRSLTVEGTEIDLSSGNTFNGGGGNSTSVRANRSEKEVLDEIQRAGTTPPEWYDKTRLDFPDTLDLSWPEERGGEWDSSRNVGQFLWDRINPNENKWREGVRLLHHILSTTQDAGVRQRAMLSLAEMYHNLHQDYARAAFWYHQQGIDKAPGSNPRAGGHLANCYWQLGSKAMALTTLKAMSRKPYEAIKLLGDMGDTDDAIAMAEQFSKSGDASVSFLYAGDACRVSGRLKDAEDYYRRSITAIKPAEADTPHRKRDRARAESSLSAIRFYTLDPKKVKDGTWSASSIGYEADVKVEVVVKSGRIEDVRVVQHREKQFYSSITDTPRKILSRQSVKEVDSTTGATITSEAIINATAQALASGL